MTEPKIKNYVVFTISDTEEGMVQLSNPIHTYELAVKFCEAWKSKTTYILAQLEDE